MRLDRKTGLIVSVAGGVLALGIGYAWGLRDQQKKLVPPEEPVAQVSELQESEPEPQPSPTLSSQELRKHPSELTRMALGRVPRERKELWDKYILELLPNYTSKSDLRIAEEALRDYEHVVFHTSARHSLARNHMVLRQLDKQIREICARFEVRPEPVEAVMSWENSGSVASVSYAGAVGVCQMMEGTVQFVHDYARREANYMRQQAEELRAAGRPSDEPRIAKMLADADYMDCAVRHKTLAKQANCKDERLVVTCNLEDAVLYIKYLLEKYEGREDLAISAYHSGIDNIDDIIYTYVNDTKGYLERGSDRSGLRWALQEYDIKYSDLWEYEKTRAMLGGVRTMDGEITTSYNRSQALGDESDLYLWKVLYSWIGYQAGEEFVATLTEEHATDRELCVHGDMEVWDSLDKLQAAQREGKLISMNDERLLANKSVDCLVAVDGQGKSQRLTVKDQKLREASWWARPELLGYMASLHKRWCQEIGSDKLRLPVRAISGAVVAAIPEMQGTVPEKTRLRDVYLDGCGLNHRRGVAFDLDYSGLPAEHRRVLARLLESDYIFDKVYLHSTKEGAHVVLNPRWGDEFLKEYEQAKH